MIETPRLYLRQFKPGDAADLYAYLSLPEVYRFEPGEPVTTEQVEQLAFERSQALDFWAVELKSESRLIGHVSFFKSDPAEWLTWEVGYIFNPQYQQRGFATEAVKGLVAYAFKELSAHRIVASCNPENIASWRVLEKAGFMREAHLHKNVYFRIDENGRPIWTDTWVYAILE